MRTAGSGRAPSDARAPARGQDHPDAGTPPCTARELGCRLHRCPERRQRGGLRSGDPLRLGGPSRVSKPVRGNPVVEGCPRRSGAFVRHHRYRRVARRTQERNRSHAANQLQARLARLPDVGRNLLVIIDELPILVSRMLRTGGEIRDAELLMSWFRQLRQAPELRERICTLVGGSIGLEGVLRRAGLSGSINDLVPFRLDSWSRSTAAEFLKSLGFSYEFTLDDASVTRLLDLLRGPIPYHVQLFFSPLCEICRGDAARGSPEAIEQCFAERLSGTSGTALLDHYATRLEIALDEHEHAMAVGILRITCRRARGATLAELEDLRRSDERTFASVLRNLEANGYSSARGRPTGIPFEPSP